MIEPREPDPFVPGGTFYGHGNSRAVAEPFGILPLDPLTDAMALDHRESLPELSLESSETMTDEAIVARVLDREPALFQQSRDLMFAVGWNIGQHKVLVRRNDEAPDAQLSDGMKTGQVAHTTILDE